MAEATPVIRVMFAKLKDAWFELSEEEQQEFMLKDRKRLEELGYKLHFMCDSRWSNDEWGFFGVEEWPSIEAVQEIAAFHEEELRASRYAEYKTYLGVPIVDEYTQS